MDGGAEGERWKTDEDGGEQKPVWKILKTQWLAPEKSVSSGIPVWSNGLPTAPLHYCAVYARGPEMPLQP